MPFHIWSFKSLKAIGDSLGIIQRATSKNLVMEGVPIILVSLDMNGELPRKVVLECGEWLRSQYLDYKCIPFRYRFFHVTGHVPWDCPWRNITY
jgi:hypothetical protein